MSAPFMIRAAIWLGLVTAAGEAAIRLGGKLFAGQPLNYGIRMLWMTPVAEVVLFLAIAAALLVATRVVRRVAARPVPAGLVIGILLFPAWLSALLFVPRIHLWAQLLAAAGLAAQSVRVLLPRVQSVERVVRRSVTPLAAVAVVVGVAVEGSAAFRTWWLERKLGPARPGAPNVLLLIWDTARASSLSTFGYGRPTSPGLSALAERGIAFDRAISTAPWTLPSHASMFTGRWAHELTTNWRTPLDDRDTTLAEVLARAGYRTGAFGANRFYVTREYGLDRGFTRFEEVRSLASETIRSSRVFRLVASSRPVRLLTGYDETLGRASAPRMARALQAWLARGDSTRPYFAFVNFMDAHAPYLPRAPYDTAFGWYPGSISRMDRVRQRLLTHLEPPAISDEGARELERAYDGALAELDASTHRLLQDLESSGHLRNTLIVVTSDHGEEFGEHGQFGHGNSLYLQSLHVPLIMAFPDRLPRGARVRTTVSLRDLPATILDVLDVPVDFPGSSLRGTWETAAQDADNVVGAALAEVRYMRGVSEDGPLARGDMRTVVTDSLQLIQDGAGNDSLFDLALDPTGGRAALDQTKPLPLLRALLRRDSRSASGPTPSGAGASPVARPMRP
ncbi:MAG TPA: sulfatase [Gemmatimonadaceae bacterium]|nr:sulfatase [Gemmatimonadaceae bacterium]